MTDANQPSSPDTPNPSNQPSSGQPYPNRPDPYQQYPNQPYPNQPGPYYQPAPYDGQPPEQLSGLTITAMTVGIVALVVAAIPIFGFVSFVLGPLAIILGIIGLVKKRPKKGFSITGIITGALALLLCILYLAIGIALAGVFGNATSQAGTYTYKVVGEGTFQVTYTTTSLFDRTTNQATGQFSAEVEASKLLGTLEAHNTGNTAGDLTCTITDSTGRLISTNTASGTGASVICATVAGMDKDGDGNWDGQP
ncbi:hypothetical protein GCM10023081_41980 [Arthrobacter ginkgonis]|uniref:DUF4190 domain-containing protein n=1 Tax=Arthrobacter ginkgonis TaxID=1630594 RepID=A0ABP7D5V0_9MICC